MKIQILTIALIIMINLLHLTALTACAQAQGNKLTMAKANAGKEQVGNVLFARPKNWEKLNLCSQLILPTLPKAKQIIVVLGQIIKMCLSLIPTLTQMKVLGVM